MRAEGNELFKAGKYPEAIEKYDDALRFNHSTDPNPSPNPNPEPTPTPNPTHNHNPYPNPTLTPSPTSNSAPNPNPRYTDAMKRDPASALPYRLDGGG